VKRMVLLSALGASACVTAPLDLVSAARRASESGDLLRTLAYVDHVSPSHPRYKEALALAAEAERRIADSQRRVAGALRARLLGDEARAAVELAEARALWPKAILLDGVELVAPMTAALAAPSPPAVEIVHGAPGPGSDRDGLPRNLPRPPACVHEAPPPLPVAFVPEPAATHEASIDEPLEAIGPPIDQEARSVPAPLDLQALRAVAQGRDQHRAITQLSAAHRDHPDEPEVRAMLAGFLRQRALVAYGRGWLEAAIEDWQRVVDLLPEDAVARSHLETARQEQALRLIREAKIKNAGG